MNSQSSSSLTANHRFLKFHNDDEQVKIILHDLCQIGNLWDPNIVSEFYNKMRKCKRKIPFSLEFQLVASIELEDVIEVRISHSLNCLVALSSEEYTFSFFDLKTHKRLGIFVAKEKPPYFHVEENYDGNNNDALIYGGNDSVVKYDLKTVLEKQGASNYIWQQSAICNARGIVSSRDRYSSNIIYVCYVDQITALNSKTGDVLYKIDKNHNGIQLDDLSGIDITDTNDTLFVVQNGHIRKLRRCPSSETILWQSELLFGQGHVKRSDGFR
ncbi:hypothetical protein C9374_011932 [Naegleria lovaniensis]|uniref:Uncharacterized protein n=1 Tax=Naegleria lovaniensis TaxID=51637 RepID=A0AA88GE94_NAELO|nr:uncharacterized protein C9374_011932 [Naegleria lovaniensis]KAG2373643.1 hypothetical protein C9374_011932 [Naegleria lovaniensis]